MGGQRWIWRLGGAVVVGCLLGCGKKEAPKEALPPEAASRQEEEIASPAPEIVAAPQPQPKALDRLADRPSAGMPPGIERAAAFGAEMIAERIADLEKEMVGLAEQIHAAETRARREQPELSRAYEAMIASRQAYDEQLARVEEYQALNARRLELQEEHKALSKRLDRIGQERKTP